MRCIRFASKRRRLDPRTGISGDDRGNRASMLTVIGCFIIEHDPWLLTLAAIICALASTSTIALLHHAKQTRVGRRSGWVAVAAVAGGSGIWATHFLGMLATDPGLIPAYAVGLTVLSLVFAIVVSGLGLAIAVFWRA